MEHLSLFKPARSRYWHIQYETSDGIRRQRSTRCKTKADALKVFTDFQNFQSENHAHKRIPFSSFMIEFMEYARTNYSQHTAYLYEKTSAHFVRICSDLPLSKYTAKHYDLYKVTRLKDPVQGKIPKNAPKRPMSPITVNIELRCLRSIFNTAVRWEAIKNNPFGRMALISIPKTTPAFLTVEDANRLLNAIDRQWLKEIVIFAINTGMRRGELLSLRWQDISVESRTARISNRADFATKSGEERTVALNDAALAVIARCQRSDKHEYIFSRENGLRVLPDWLTSAFKSAARKAGLAEGIHLHSTRHSFASLLVGGGTSLFTVSKLLGHSNAKTSEIYSHLLPQHLQTEVDKIKIGLDSIPPKNPV